MTETDRVVSHAISPPLDAADGANQAVPLSVAIDLDERSSALITRLHIMDHRHGAASESDVKGPSLRRPPRALEGPAVNRKRTTQSHSDP